MSLRLVMLSAFVLAIAPEHKLRVIAPDVGGGFGSKIFIYAEEMVACCLGLEAYWSDARSSGRPSAAKAFLDRLPMAATMSPMPSLLLDKDRQGHSALKVKTIRQSMGAYLSTFSSCGTDLSLCDTAVGPVQHPATSTPK